MPIRSQFQFAPATGFRLSLHRCSCSDARRWSLHLRFGWLAIHIG